MKLSNPLCITPRLLPGAKIGEAFISIKRQGVNAEGRDRFQWFLDLGIGRRGKSFSGTSLRSGVGGCTLQKALATLLGFMGAAAEAYSHKRRTGTCSDNLYLFEDPVVEWCYQHEDELTSLEMELEEKEGVIEE